MENLEKQIVLFRLKVTGLFSQRVANLEEQFKIDPTGMRGGHNLVGRAVVENLLDMTTCCVEHKKIAAMIKLANKVLFTLQS